MFELTNETLRDPAFGSGMSKVLNAPTKDVKKAYNVGRIGTLLEQHSKEAAKVFEKLVGSHGTINPDGTFQIDETKIDEWKNAHAEFLQHKVKVERHKIRVEDVSGISLTPLEITALEPLLDGLDTLNDESAVKPS